MGDIPEDLKRAVWRRDRYRCQECGIAVAGQRGCKPQTHHMVPRHSSGSEEMENLTTLCLPCHATKESPGHRRLLLAASPEELPNYVKWSLWALALDLLAYAEWISPLRFPSRQVLEWLRAYRNALEGVIDLSLKAAMHDTRYYTSMSNTITSPPAMPEEFEALLGGVRIGWYAHAHQEFLDEQLRIARARWSRDK